MHLSPSVLIAGSPLWWEAGYKHGEHSQTHTHTSSIPVSDSYTHHWPVLSWPISKWLTGCFLLLQQEVRRAVQTKGSKVYVREGKRDQATYYSDVNLLMVRQTGEQCHSGTTNRRQRNGATYDISAGLGWELAAWGSFPLSRQTEGAEWYSRHQWYKNLQP